MLKADEFRQARDLDVTPPQRERPTEGRKRGSPEFPVDLDPSESPTTMPVKFLVQTVGDRTAKADNYAGAVSKRVADGANESGWTRELPEMWHGFSPGLSSQELTDNAIHPPFTFVVRSREMELLGCPEGALKFVVVQLAADEVAGLGVKKTVEIR